MTKLLIQGDESEQALEFSLTHSGDGEIQLRVGIVGDDTENKWYIAAIQPDGTLKLNGFLPRMDFFQREGDDDHIKVVKE